MGSGPGDTLGGRFFVSARAWGNNHTRGTLARMTMRTTEDAGGVLSREMAVASRQLKTLSDLLETIQAELRGADGQISSEAQKTMTQLSGWIKTALIMERDLEQRQKSEAGIVRGDYALDLDAAKYEVRCRLGRLRRCCTEG